MRFFRLSALEFPLVHGRSALPRSGLTFIGETKHRLVENMQYTMINTVARCLHANSSNSMPRHMRVSKVFQAKKLYPDMYEDKQWVIRRNMGKS